MGKYIKNNKGLTLIEVIVSIALLGLVVMGFMQLFTVSSIVTSKSEDVLEATYTGKDTMELIYNLSTTIEYGNLDREELMNQWIELSDDVNLYAEIDGESIGNKSTDGESIELKLSEYGDGDLVNVVTRVLNNGKEEAKYQAYYQWKGQADSNEE